MAAAFEVLEGAGIESRYFYKVVKAAIFVYELPKLSLVVFRHRFAGGPDGLVVAEFDAQGFVTVVAFAVGIVFRVFNGGVVAVGDVVLVTEGFPAVIGDGLVGDFLSFFATVDVS